jgi:hypothetical protein
VLTDAAEQGFSVIIRQTKRPGRPAGPNPGDAVKDKDEPKEKGLPQFTKDVLYAALVGVTAQAHGGAAFFLAAAMVALIVAGWDVPAWTLMAMAILAIALVYVTRRVAGREAAELRPTLNEAEDELDRHDPTGATSTPCSTPSRRLSRKTSICR